MNDTIKNNIIYMCGLENFDSERFSNWIQILSLNDFFDDVDKGKGIEMLLNEQLLTISGGEKQKIGLLRTFLKNGDIIILDEPTNSLDRHSMKIIEDLLLEIKDDKIIIMSSHDRNIIKIADQTIDMETIGNEEYKRCEVI